MKNLAITLVAFISCVSSAARGKSNCVWYGECGNARGFKQPCPANHTALQLDHEEAEKILLKRCPHLFNGSEPPKTCCDPNQIMTMDKSLQMAEAIFGRCESCAKNLFRSICDFTCASDQARFMKATNWATEPSTGKEYITSVQIYISQEYTHATRESCSRVINPMTGTSALDIACGGNTGNKCTAERWFNFMGNSTINVMAPFDLVYCYHGEDALAPGPPLNPPTKLCSEAYDNSSSACSCVDCPGSCSSNDQWEISTPSFEFWGISGYGLIVGAVVVFISSCWSIVLIYLRKRTARIDRPIVTIRPVDQRPTRNLNTVTERIFVAWGRAFAQSPAVVLLSTAFIVIALSIGIKFLIVTVNPIEIWASPTSQSRIDKDYFDKHFQPFYRTEQIYLKSVGLEKITHETSIGTLVFGPVFQKEFLLAVYHLQDKIMQLGQDTDEGLEKICYAPVQNEFTGPVTLPLCTVQSVWGYFQNDLDLFNSTTNDNGYEENYLDQLYLCIQNSYNPECLSTYNGPVIPDITFGGYLQPDQITVEVSDYINATGLVLSFMVRNSLNETEIEPMLKWEQKYLDFLKNWTENEKPEYMEIAYSAERSIEDELKRTSIAESRTMVISYLVMFVYIACALGKFKRSVTCFVTTRFFLSIGGIVMVLASVSASLGIFGYIGVPTTLLTIEVIPFLVLAVGVDNIFILVQTHDRYPRKSSETVVDHMGLILGMVGPSMLLTSISECLCFAIGTLSKMPAVNTFAMYASVSILINFLLQITAFVSLLALDTRRYEGGRFDMLCCVGLDSQSIINTDKGSVQKFFEDYYTPFLMKKRVRIVILTIFVAVLTIHIVVAPQIEIGLEQKLSMPEDSYVLKYFQYMDDLLSMGPPVYFVVTSGLNYSLTSVQNAICGGPQCNSNSLYSQLFSAANQSLQSYLAKPGSSWLDDYFDWTSVQSCCKYFPNNGSFCPHDSAGCLSCQIDKANMSSRPTTESFRKYISYFVSDIPDAYCAKGGRAAYYDALTYFYDEYGRIDVGDTYFMSYHSPLKKSSDWYKALEAARFVAKNITNTINEANLSDEKIRVFPYSVFYVFYEQYLTIWYETLESLGLSLFVIFVVTYLLTGRSLFSAFIVLLTVTMIIINLAGFMHWCNVSLNAVSLVNLVMGVGISVEFCSHVVHHYLYSDAETRVGKIAATLNTIGSSVFAGITLTKLVGIIVLAFAKTQIFQVFYFRMYLGILLMGATHGLIFLPALLSFIGPLDNANRGLENGYSSTFCK
ncbi:NPC intracellular cholesterol transporter 1 homolog 1b-like [Venturia canescens]|uniref:NPC intracellular cholesterol transporter 1 homolog 1b-like n=1 Tax=Venturia canescens TaxID=32260 RepID=UPI001C9BDC01|nr:NPC intracellular cholesterol transporter 1 homolog 1b-like [Venturia canescens]XP_043277997.1 NPC intracellular cholesterol transporter 1 homolog 1b-like [Venturia canescens]